MTKTPENLENEKIAREMRDELKRRETWFGKPIDKYKNGDVWHVDNRGCLKKPTLYYKDLVLTREVDDNEEYYYVCQNGNGIKGNSITIYSAIERFVHNTKNAIDNMEYYYKNILKLIE